MTTARSTASVRSREQPWHPAGAEGGEEPAPTYPQAELPASGSTARLFYRLTAGDGEAGGPMGSPLPSRHGHPGNKRGRNATEIQGICERSRGRSKTEPSLEKAGISEEEMQQKSKGSANDPEHVNTQPCPEKGHGVGIPKRGAFPTPKGIIESSPQYTPEGGETTGGESATEPVSSTNAEKKRH